MMPLGPQDEQTLASWEDKHLDPDYNMAKRRYRCPACGSIEIRKGRCAWCHGQVIHEAEAADRNRPQRSSKRYDSPGR